jgi:hypothetical protein
MLLRIARRAEYIANSIVRHDRLATRDPPDIGRCTFPSAPRTLLDRHRNLPGRHKFNAGCLGLRRHYGLKFTGCSELNLFNVMREAEHS